MNYKQTIINDYHKNISSHLNEGDHQAYLITTTFNMTNHKPDDIESDWINRIKHLRKNDPESNLLPELYNQLSDYRFKVNTSLNHKIYEKDITQKRLTWIWNQYDIFQTHLVKTLINNAGRSNKIELYPRTYDFVDAFGSKHGNVVWDDDFSIHLHSIYLIRNEISEKFDRLIAGNFHQILWHPRLNGIRGAHGEKIDSGPDDLVNVIEYASKFIMSIGPLAAKNGLPLSFQYPITEEERRLKRQHAQMTTSARSPF